MEIFEIAKKFVGKDGSDFQGLGLPNPSASSPNRALKSAFPDFHGNASIFPKSLSVKTFLNPVRAYLPNFVPIGR